MKLPNADKADIDPRKLMYLASSGKLKFFEMHGFDISRPQELTDALRDHPIRNAVEDVIPAPPHGVKYTVRCSIASPDGRNPCTLTVWMVDAGSVHPRFISGWASPVRPPVFPNLP